MDSGHGSSLCSLAGLYCYFAVGLVDYKVHLDYLPQSGQCGQGPPYSLWAKNGKLWNFVQGLDYLPGARRTGVARSLWTKNRKSWNPLVCLPSLGSVDRGHPALCGLRMKNYETLPGSGLSSISLGSVDRGCPALCGLGIEKVETLSKVWTISPTWAVWRGRPAFCGLRIENYETLSRVWTRY